MNGYDWAAYYQAAYEKEKKKRMRLAGLLVKSETQKEELFQRISGIENNAFWKLSKRPRRYYHAVASRMKAALDGKGKTDHTSAVSSENLSAELVNDILLGKTPEDCEREYQEEVFRQRHPYLQWIAANEKTPVLEKGKPVDGWRKIEFPQSDLCLVVCGHGIIDAGMEEIVESWFNKNEKSLFAYADEDYYWEDLTNRMHPWYKPCWSPDTMLSFCYMGHMIVTRQSLCNDILAQERYRNGTPADFYDLCLRLEERSHSLGREISHIEEVLFHNCFLPDASGEKQILQARQDGGDVLETVESLLLEELEQGRDLTGAGSAYRRVREDALQRRGIKAHLEPGLYPDIYHVVYEVPENKGMVSVIIPSKDHPQVLEKCLRSFREKTDYPAYEWIVVDNGSDAQNKRRMEELQKEYGFLYLYEPMEFNFSAMCNLGAAKAGGEYLLFLNDDIEIIEKDWLRIMAGQAAQPHAGAVGAKLWYAETENIQHTGITNLDIGPSHKLITFPDNKGYYYGRNQVTYDMIGVTAACLLVGREKFREAGGMNEEMKVSYNDVDFCFRLAEAGYYNVLRNDAVLYHHESLSRGLDEADDGKWDRLLLEKENLYDLHPAMKGADCFYHKNLIDNASHYACNFKYDYEKNQKVTEICAENASKLANMQENVLKLTIDRAEAQHKIHREEMDIMWIMGWAYVPGQDNSRYVRNLVLQQDEDVFYRVPANPWARRDAEAVLTGEVGISLAGFAVRIETEKLHAGIWKIGMIAIDSDTKKSFLTWSDKKMTVK